MAVRLNITIDEKLYRRMKKELPPKGISAFIETAVRARLAPGREVLNRSYRAARKEKWRRTLAKDWGSSEVEGWPE